MAVTKISDGFREEHSRGCSECSTTKQDTTNLVKCIDEFSSWIEGRASDSLAEFQSHLSTLGAWVRGEDQLAASVSKSQLWDLAMYLGGEYTEHAGELQDMLKQEQGIYTACNTLLEGEGWCEESRHVLSKMRDATAPTAGTSVENWLSCAESILVNATQKLLADGEETDRDQAGGADP